MDFVPRELLPDAISPMVALLLVAAAGITSFMTAACGIGGGVTLLAVMAMIMPPAGLIPVHGVVQLGSNLGRALIMLRHIHLRMLLSFGAGGLIGAVAGGLVVVELPPTVLQTGLAVFILYSAWGPQPRLGTHGLWLGGAASSFLTMFFGATGPFVAALVKAFRLDRLTHVGTFSACMSLQHGLKLITFGLLGFTFAPWLPLLVAMLAAGFLGTCLGRLVLGHLDDGRFHLVLNLILTALAVRLLWTAATAGSW